jgi:hypothetical protein
MKTNVILTSLKAYRVEAGMSDAAAAAWAAANLNAGVARFSTKLGEYRDPEAGLEAAYADLKAWAQS